MKHVNNRSANEVIIDNDHGVTVDQMSGEGKGKLVDLDSEAPWRVEKRLSEHMKSSLHGVWYCFELDDLGFYDGVLMVKDVLVTEKRLRTYNSAREYSSAWTFPARITGGKIADLALSQAELPRIQQNQLDSPEGYIIVSSVKMSR